MAKTDNLNDFLVDLADALTVGTAFAKDELGWWGDKLSKSLVGANIYTPDQYAPNWELVQK